MAQNLWPPFNEMTTSAHSIVDRHSATQWRTVSCTAWLTCDVSSQQILSPVAGVTWIVLARTMSRTIRTRYHQQQAARTGVSARSICVWLEDLPSAIGTVDQSDLRSDPPVRRFWHAFRRPKNGAQTAKPPTDPHRPASPRSGRVR